MQNPSSKLGYWLLNIHKSGFAFHVKTLIKEKAKGILWVKKNTWAPRVLRIVLTDN